MDSIVEKALILVVDDNKLSRKMTEDLLISIGHEVITAENGTDAIDQARNLHPDIVILDVVMPVMDGFTACAKLKKDEKTKHIPIILVTSLEGRESKLRGLSVGANDFLAKPVDEAELTIRTKNLLRIKKIEDLLRQHNEELDSQVRERTRQLSDTLDKLQLSKEDLNKSYLDTIFKLTAVAEYKDGFTAAHIKKVGYYCRVLSRELGWSEELQEMIFYASPMHDIGKVGVPSEILLKAVRLTEEEFALMKTHTVSGARILHGSNSKFLQMAEIIAQNHHERWDGSGYPEGLRGEEIPVAGMVMSLADQYDSLRSERPYKLGLDHEKTFRIITEGDGRTQPEHFDSRLLEAFKDCCEEFNEIYGNFPSRFD